MWVIVNIVIVNQPQVEASFHVSYYMQQEARVSDCAHFVAIISQTEQHVNKRVSRQSSGGFGDVSCSAPLTRLALGRVDPVGSGKRRGCGLEKLGLMIQAVSVHEYRSS